MNIETLLHEEIVREMSNLKGLEVDSETYKTQVDGLTKLVDRAIELDRLNIEHQDKKETRKFENDFKLKQMDDENKDRLIRNILTAAGIVIPTAVTVWGTIKSIKFEETGTITTIMGRGFINKLLPKK